VLAPWGDDPRLVHAPHPAQDAVGHVGSDDVYGTVDQSVRQQSFRLKVDGQE
jgi:hypothetical protein